MDLSRFYRFRDWVKNLGLCLLAYTTNEISSFPFLLLNLFQSSLLLSYLFSINNFFDYKILKEKNYISSLKIEDWKKIILCALPIFVLIPTLFIKYNFIFIAMVLLFIFLSTIYSAPPRLRDKTFFDVFANCLIFTVFYLQSYFFSNEKFNLNSIFFVLIVFLYLLFQEILHQLAHFKKDKKSGMKKTVVSIGFERSISFLKGLPIIYSFIAFLLFFITNEFVFVVMLFFNLLRINKTKEINKDSDFLYLRDNVYGIYEFVTYILLNIWLK